MLGTRQIIVLPLEASVDDERISSLITNEGSSSCILLLDVDDVEMGGYVAELFVDYKIGSNYLPVHNFSGTFGVGVYYFVIDPRVESGVYNNIQQGFIPRDFRVRAQKLSGKEVTYSLSICYLHS